MENECLPDWKTTRVFRENLEAYYQGYRRAANEGGTWSTKTYSITQALVWIAQHAKEPTLISTVSESFPHLRRGCIRDFQMVMGKQWDDRSWSKTEHIYDFGRAQMEFFSADKPSKQRGARRQILFMNECNNIPYEAYQELNIRTRDFTYLDWNPVGEFWAHQNNILTANATKYIHSTYLDGKHVLPESVVREIESYRLTDPNWWNVYGLGRLGKVTGLVYPYFSQEDELPKGDNFMGLDFGFTNDPAVLTNNVIIGDELHSDELFFEAGMRNDMIAHRMTDLGVRRNFDEIFADSAEPKSIAEIAAYGFNIKPCPKGADSVEFGHQKIRQYKQFWTKRSVKCIKEQRNFQYIKDKDGKFTEKTTHAWSHGMDSRRYAVIGKMAPNSADAWAQAYQKIAATNKAPVAD